MTTGGSVPGGKRRRFAMARFEIIAISASALVPGWKENLDETHTGQRTRLDVVDATAECEESFKAAGYVGFNLLRGHA